MTFERVALGELVRLKRGFDLPEHARRAGSVPVVSSRGVTGCHDVARARGPGVVTGRTGTLGRVHYVEGDFWPLNTTLFVEDFRGNDPRFVGYLLQTIDFHRHNDKAAIPGVDRRHLHAIEVVRPARREQQRIGRRLASFDRRRRLLARLDQRAKEMAETLFELLPAATTRRVEQLCDRIGNGGTPPRRRREYWHGDVDWFKSGELADGPLLHASESIHRRAIDETACRVWPEGTVLVAMYAAPTVGRLGILSERAAVNQACCALVAPSAPAGRFLFHALLATRARLETLAVGAAQQNVNQGIVRAHEVAWPGARAARAFGERVAPLHRLRIACLEERGALDALQAALIPEVVTGSIRLRA